MYREGSARDLLCGCCCRQITRAVALLVMQSFIHQDKYAEFVD